MPIEPRDPLKPTKAFDPAGVNKEYTERLAKISATVRQIGAAFDSLEGSNKRFHDTARGLFDDLKSGAASTATETSSKLGGAFNLLIILFSKAAGSLGGVSAASALLQRSWADMALVGVGALAKVTDSAGRARAGLLGLGDILQSAGTVGQSAGSRIGDTLAEAAASGTAALSRLGAAAGGSLGGAAQTAAAAFNSMAGSSMAAIGDVDAAARAAAAAFNGLAGSGAAAMGGVGAAGRAAAGKVSDAFAGLRGSAADSLAKIEDAGSLRLTGLSATASKALYGLADVFKAVWRSMSGASGQDAGMLELLTNQAGVLQGDFSQLALQAVRLKVAIGQTNDEGKKDDLSRQLEGVVRQQDAVRLKSAENASQQDEVKKRMMEQAKSMGVLQSAFASVSAYGTAAFAGITGAVLSFGALASPGMFHQFTLALRDLGGVIGQMLLPILDVFTRTIRGIADWLAQLSPSTRSMVTSVAALGIAFGAVAIAVSTFVIPAISACIAAFAALDVVSGGILVIIGAVVTSLAAMGVWLATTESGTSLLKETWKGLEPLFDSVQILIAACSELFRTLAEVLFPNTDAFKILGTVLYNMTVGPLAALIDGISLLVITFGVLFEMLSNPLGFLAIGKAFDEIARRFEKFQKQVADAKKASSVGAAAGKAQYMSLEQAAKNVHVAALESGIKGPNEEDVKKREEEDKKQREKWADEVQKVVAGIGLVQKLEAIADAIAPLPDFLRVARRIWFF